MHGTLAYCECATVKANAGISDQLMFPFHTHPEERLWLPTSSCFKHWGHCSVQGIRTTLASARVSFSPHSNCHFCNDRSSSDFHRLNFSDDDRFWVLLHIPVCLHGWPTSFLRSSLVILFTYWVIWALHWFPFSPILEAVSSCCTFSLDYIRVLQPGLICHTTALF